MDDTKTKRGHAAGGPPLIVLTDEQLIEVQALAAVLTTEQIADYLGISRRTFFNILDRQDGVRALYKKGRARQIAAMAVNLVSQAKKGNVAANIFYLKTQAGWREVGGDEAEDAEPVEVTFGVTPAVNKVQVTNAKPES